LVELELDDAGAIHVRPRGVDPILALKPFTASNNPGTDLVARFAREHFAKLPPERELSPFERETFTPILRYACAQFDRAGRYHPDHVGQDDRKVPEAGPNLASARVLGVPPATRLQRKSDFSIPDSWSRQLFIALCRRYGISPFRYRRMHRQTVIITAPRSFIEHVLWPEFRELSAALSAYLAEITEKLIREEVHGETADAEERDEPGRLSRWEAAPPR
jgi:hypothetical protein